MAQSKLKKRTLCLFFLALSCFVNFKDAYSSEKVINCEDFADAVSKSLDKIQEMNPQIFERTLGGGHFPKDSNPASVYRGKMGEGRDRVVGFEYNQKPDFVRVRTDYDPTKGAHVNLEMGKGNQREKYAFKYKGGERTHAEVVKRLEKSDRNAKDVAHIFKNISDSSSNNKSKSKSIHLKGKNKRKEIHHTSIASNKRATRSKPVKDEMIKEGVLPENPVEQFKNNSLSSSEEEAPLQSEESGQEKAVEESE